MFVNSCILARNFIFQFFKLSYIMEKWKEMKLNFGKKKKMKMKIENTKIINANNYKNRKKN